MTTANKQSWLRPSTETNYHSYVKRMHTRKWEHAVETVRQMGHLVLCPVSAHDWHLRFQRNIQETTKWVFFLNNKPT